MVAPSEVALVEYVIVCPPSGSFAAAWTRSCEPSFICLSDMGSRVGRLLAAGRSNTENIWTSWRSPSITKRCVELVVTDLGL